MNVMQQGYNTKIFYSIACDIKSRDYENNHLGKKYERHHTHTHTHTKDPTYLQRKSLLLTAPFLITAW